MTKLEEMPKRLSKKYWSDFIIKQIEPVMGIREFLDGKHIDFENYIIGETRPLEKHEINEWLVEDEIKIKLLTEINNELKNQKQELINYLKSEDTDLKENVVNLEEKLRNTPKESFYYNAFLKALHRFRAKRELIKEILSKIEKE